MQPPREGVSARGRTRLSSGFRAKMLSSSGRVGRAKPGIHGPAQPEPPSALHRRRYQGAADSKPSYANKQTARSRRRETFPNQQMNRAGSSAVDRAAAPGEVA